MFIRVIAGIFLLLSAGAAFADPLLVSSALPTARVVKTGDTATYFATIINAGDMEATNCLLAKFSQNAAQQNFFPGGFAYQTVDASNVATGTPNTPINIPAGGTQSFVFALTPMADFSGIVQVHYQCDGGFQAPLQPELNIVQLTASDPAKADPIGILATPTADGILAIGTAGGIAAAGGAVVNVQGTAATVRATPRVAFNPKGATASICETDNLGACMATPSAFVDIVIGSVGSTFSIFVDANDQTGMANLPAILRLFVDFSEPGGAFLSGTSVAITAPPPSITPAPQFPSGYYRTQIRYQNDTFASEIQNGYLLVDLDGSIFGLTEWSSPNFGFFSSVFEGIGNWSPAAAASSGGKSRPQDAPLNDSFTGIPSYPKTPGNSVAFSLDDMFVTVFKVATNGGNSSDFSSLTGAITGDPSFHGDPNAPKGDTANAMIEALLLFAAQKEAPNKSASRPLALADASYTLVDALAAKRFSGTSVLAGSVDITGTNLAASVTYTSQQACTLSATIGAQINTSSVYRLPSLTVADCTTNNPSVGTNITNAIGEYEGFLILNEVNPATPGDNIRLILLKKDRSFSFALLGSKN